MILTLLSFIPGVGPFLAFAKVNSWVWKLLGAVAVVLAVLALWFGLIAHGRHLQKLADAPWITNPATKAKWKDEALAAQRDFATCKVNTSTLEISIGQQNAEIAAQGAESDRRLKMLSEGLDQARKGRAGAEARAAGLLEHPAVGVDACARSEAAARAVVESLR